MVRSTDCNPNRIAIAAWLLAATVHAGCAAPLTTGFLGAVRKKDKTADTEVTSADSPRSAALRKATGETLSQEQAFASVLDELQEIRAIDPEAERELMADLKEAKPEHYPMIVNAFRTALAYRQQLAERQSGTAGGAPLIASDDASFAQLASHQSKETERESIERATAVQASLASARTAHADRMARSPQPAAESQAVQNNDRNQQTAINQASAEVPITPAETVSLRPAPTARPLTPVDSRAVATTHVEAIASDDRTEVRVNGAAQTALTPAGDWQTELESSIANLERTVSPKPTSVSELHDHMRLRTLQLLAGREEQAYLPIPGASADQQDYWSKQLFAMSAYLDSGGKLDDKQRAAAALGALDEARAKLSELATLQIRNAAFVASVEGFGAYEPNKATNFQPGQKVTLYAEVENFRSSATEDGYHTSLATSYQVLDSTGRRVDGKQFPDVADKCRNRRRDFHMQYEFPLPTRIYPGEYVLELTITDHNSGKIGQTTLPFEIAGER